MAGQTSCAVDCSAAGFAFASRIWLGALAITVCAHAGFELPTTKPTDEPERNISRQTWDTESGLPQNTVQAILQTSDGFFWFGTEGGLARFDTERFSVFNTRNTPELHSNDIRALLEDNEGTLWIATADGVMSRSGGSFRTFTIRQGLPSNFINRLYRNVEGEICATTSAGSACFEQGRFVVSGDEAAANTVPINTSLQRYVSSSILCTLKDREGNVWIGTESSGVTILRKLHFEPFSGRAQGLDSQVRCILRAHNGDIWFGTDGQGLTRYADGRFSRFTAADGLSSNVIVSLGQDAAGDLLVGTPDGLNRLHNDAVVLTTSSEGLPDDFIRSIFTDVKGVVWLGTRRGLAQLENGAFHTFTHLDGLGSDLIGSITQDADGVLWAATLNGLSRFDGVRFDNYTTANGLSSNIITALYADKSNGLWIGTQGGGLNHFTKGVFQRVNAAEMPEIIYGITQDQQQNLWLASDAGVFRVTHAEQGSQAEVVSYGVSDGLRVSECSGGGHPVIANAMGNRLNKGIWFATLRGAALLSADVPLNSVPPPVVIESVVVDNKMLKALPSIQVGPGVNRLAIAFAALSASAPQKVQFRYRLQGFDKAWNYADASRTAFYTNLAPGAYNFRVIARNGDGVWNRTGASLTLQVKPQFYQTWWFLALVIVALALAVFGGYRWRVARVEAGLQSRFEAVLSERNRIAREIHDTLAQGFAGVSVQLEIVTRKLSGSAEGAREHLDQARMLVRSSLAEARRSIWELRSQSTEIEDLAARLSKMAAQMGAGAQAKISLDIRGTFRPLPARTEDELLRIAQEALTNAIRHAQADAINIELAFDPKLVRMTIADDGRGFSSGADTGGVNGHFGLKGMRERASILNAKLMVDSAPNAGTKLSVEVPV